MSEWDEPAWFEMCEQLHKTRLNLFAAGKQEEWINALGCELAGILCAYPDKTLDAVLTVIRRYAVEARDPNNLHSVGPAETEH